jgi:hydrogenase expression/formation protein HypC
MCIGIPMQVVETDSGSAWCERRGQRERLDTMLVGDVLPGSWVLAFRGCALRVMTADDAAHTNDALDALEAALAGETNFDAYFADLVAPDPHSPAPLPGTNP